MSEIDSVVNKVEFLLCDIVTSFFTGPPRGYIKTPVSLLTFTILSSILTIPSQFYIVGIHRVIIFTITVVYMSVIITSSVRIDRIEGCIKINIYL